MFYSRPRIVSSTLCLVVPLPSPSLDLSLQLGVMVADHLPHQTQKLCPHGFRAS